MPDATASGEAALQMVRFVNELGNTITIDAEPYNDPKGFTGVRISITGPSSEVTNEITVEEAKHMNDVLHVCLDAMQRGHSPPADTPCGSP